MKDNLYEKDFFMIEKQKESSVKTSKEAKVRKQTNTSVQRKLFVFLGTVCALGGSVVGSGLYAINKISSESGQIGRAVGEYNQKKYAEVKALNQKTEEASQNRSDYQTECESMARIVCHLAKRYSQKSPDWIIEESCVFFENEQTGNPKKDIIVEDMQTMKKYFQGTTRDLRNVMCYYHTSPEVKFFNRYSEPFEVRDGIYRYEKKVRQYLYDKYGEKRKSMFDKSR